MTSNGQCIDTDASSLVRWIKRNASSRHSLPSKEEGARSHGFRFYFPHGQPTMLAPEFFSPASKEPAATANLLLFTYGPDPSPNGFLLIWCTSKEPVVVRLTCFLASIFFYYCCRGPINGLDSCMEINRRGRGLLMAVADAVPHEITRSKSLRFST
jgi:hypothetical protein